MRDSDEEAISSEVTSTDSATIQCLGDSDAENEDFSEVNENEKHNASMTQGLFSHWTELILIYSQAFARSPTMAFSCVRENVHLNTKLELCWKILLFIKLFY